MTKAILIIGAVLAIFLLLSQYGTNVHNSNHIGVTVHNPVT